MTRHQDLPPEHHDAFATSTRLPAALQASPPRDIPRPPWGQALAVAIFIMPHTLVGVGTAGFALFSVARALAGETVEARVERAWDTESRQKNGTTTHTRHVAVRVPDGEGRRREVELSFSGVGPDVGDTVKVISLAGTGHDHVDNAHVMAVAMPFFAAFWNAIVAVFWVMVVGRRVVARRLHRDGIAVMGRVREVRKRKQTEVVFEYTPRGTGQVLTATAPMVRDAIAATREGQPVPVLHMPDKPHLCVAFGVCHDAAWGRPRT